MEILVDKNQKEKVVMSHKLFIITGIAGAGKSTLAKEMIEEGLIDTHVEADFFMVDNQGKYAFDPKKLHYCHEKCRKLALEACKKGLNFACSNTNLQRWEVKPYIDMAKDYGYHIEIIHLTTQYQSQHGVPPEKILEMQAKRQFFQLSDFE